MIEIQPARLPKYFSSLRVNQAENLIACSPVGGNGPARRVALQQVGQAVAINIELCQVTP
ncbi:hypothetical protein QQ054_33930 [Oscillatoria amoena NRMC-F 0135]|nr:hypothetical protein [Oscillatoria amoena NRMC-F 0135]